MSALLCEGLSYPYEWIRDQFDRNSAELPPYTRQTLTFCQRWLRGEQTFTIQTSGSTGKPKPITLHRSQMIASAHLTGQAVGLRRGDRALVCLNSAYIAGIMMLVRGFELGLEMVIVEPSSHPLQGFEVGAFAFTAIVPLQLQGALAVSAERDTLNAMRAVLVGGAPISHGLAAQLQTLNATIYHTYGMTETVSHVALRRLNGEGASDFFIPQPTIDLWLDQRGCLSICGSVTRGETIATNDRVAFQADGSFRWLGRIDNVINSGGVKVQAEKVERALEKQLPDVRLFVTGTPDSVLGEAVTAFVESTPQPVDVALGLTRYEQPRQVHFLRQFMETPTGKVDRMATVALLAVV